MAMTKPLAHFYEFGPFHLDTAERRLLRDGRAVPLTPKAYEMLLALVERSGHIVEKDELLKEVWPEQFVEEGNLSQHVFALRKALGESRDETHYIETVPRRGYRFVAQVREVADRDAAVVVEKRTRATISVGEAAGGGEAARIEAGRAQTLLPGEAKVGRGRKPGRAILLPAGLAILVAACGILLYRYYHRTPPLTDKDTILLADFDNKTGDPAFDGALKQGLAVQLEQSPFLNIFSDEKIRETLRYMGRSPDEPVTKEVGREICRRQGLKAVLAGSVLSLGSHYVIGLEAVNAQTGDVVAREQVEAENKEQMIQALGSAATKLREKLGESLQSIQRFDAPIEQATTRSLEALQAFSLGREWHSQGKYLEAIPFYKRAVELDPNFALAYNRLAAVYYNTRQLALAAEASQKAFDLRERVSEREKLYISASYYSDVTREMDKVIEVYELLKQTYPRDSSAHNNLSLQYSNVGQYEKGAEEAREALRLSPTWAPAHGNLAYALMGLNRFEEAKEVLDRAVAQKLDTLAVHANLYTIAFIQGDAAGMRQQVEWAKGRPNEYTALEWQAQAADFVGQRHKAQELYEQAAGFAEGRGLKAEAARLASINALGEMLDGNCARVEEIAAPLALTQSRAFQIRALVMLTLCGKGDRAQLLIEELEKQYPKDTFLHLAWLPTFRAAAEASRGNAARAIELLSLRTNSPYELASPLALVPSYLRGLSYLRVGAGAEAAAEFQKILDHRGVVGLSKTYALAHLWLARSAALAGDTVKSRKAYEDFFALWKDADPEVPLLREARREYESLR